MKKHLVLLFIFWGTACAPAPDATPTPIPLSQLNLESILVVEGDLPGDLVPDLKTNKNAVGAADELDRAEIVFTQYFLLNGGEGGGVSVFLFESLEDVQAAFEKVSTMMNKPVDFSKVGERARMENFLIPLMPDVPPIEGSRLIFVRCHALAVIQFPRADDLGAIAGYGRLLDERIQPLICTDS